MKISNGKVKLEKGDVRVGNFVYHPEPNHIKMTDINGFVSFRVSTFSAQGAFLQLLLKEKDNKVLNNYAAVMFNVLGVIPDNDYLLAINTAAEECLKRHKSLYGIKDEVTEETETEDMAAAEALDGIKDIEELVDE